jgi:hypothetical protein
MATSANCPKCGSTEYQLESRKCARCKAFGSALSNLLTATRVLGKARRAAAYEIKRNYVACGASWFDLAPEEVVEGALRRLEREVMRIAVRTNARQPGYGVPRKGETYRYMQDAWLRFKREQKRRKPVVPVQVLRKAVWMAEEMVEIARERIDRTPRSSSQWQRRHDRETAALAEARKLTVGAILSDSKNVGRLAHRLLDRRFRSRTVAMALMYLHNPLYREGSLRTILSKPATL